MQDKLKDLEKEMTKLNDDDTPLTRNIRTLENRLDKAMIKYNEAQVFSWPLVICHRNLLSDPFSTSISAVLL